MRPPSIHTLHTQHNLPARALFRKVTANASWFVISFVASVAAGFVFLRYATAQYAISASLLLRDDSRGAEFGDAALEDLGVTTVKSSLDNEVEILKSRTLMEQVVNALQLNVRYFASGRVKTAEIYERSPFRVRLLQPWQATQTQRFKFIFTGKDQFIIKWTEKSVQANFGDTVRLAATPIIVYKTAFKPSKEDQYLISINSNDATVKQYTSRLNVSATNKLASLVNLSFSDILPARGERVLSRLIHIYLQTSLRDKQRIADSTIAFIDQNLTELSDELGGIETGIEHFRKRNRVTNLDEDRHLLLESFTEISNGLQKQLVRLSVIEDFEKYLHDYPEHIIPSSFFQYESSFLDAARRYNELQLQRKKENATIEDAHPILTTLDRQINSLRTNLLAGIINQKKDLLTQIEHDRKTKSELDKQIGALPGKERIFGEQLREQGTKQDLYVFLLKKRMESSISRSSTFSSAKVIDAPRADSVPVFPNKDLLLLLSGFVGLGIPLAVIYVNLIFNDKLETKEQILENCRVPVLSEISLRPKFRHFEELGNHSNAEQFRILRTNILFSFYKNECKTILVTSSAGGEGKSFVAAHLAASFALTGKKTLLLELDLRKPSLAGLLNLENTGIADYLLSDQPPDQYIQRTVGAHSFSVLLAGTPLANAAEVLSSAKIAALLALLRETFDHIIIDTPPIGLVTDARLLSHFADLSLFVVRLKQTRLSQLHEIANAFQSKHFKDLKLVVNGTKPAKGYQYDYTYQSKNRSKMPGFLRTVIQQTKNFK